MNLIYTIIGIFLQTMHLNNTALSGNEKGIRYSQQSTAATITVTLDSNGANIRNELLTVSNLRLALPKGIRFQRTTGVTLRGTVQVTLSATPGENTTETEITVQSGSEQVDVMMIPGAPMIVTPPPPKQGAPMQGTTYTSTETATNGELISITVPANGKIPDDIEDVAIDVMHWAKAEPGDVIVIVKRSKKAILDYQNKVNPATVPGDQEYWFPVPAGIPDDYRLIYFGSSYLEGHWAASSGSGWPGLAVGEEVATDPDFAVGLVMRNGSRYIRMRCRFHNLFYMHAGFSHGDLKKDNLDQRPVEGLMEGGSPLEAHPGPYYGSLSVVTFFQYKKDHLNLVWEIEKYLDNTVYKLDTKTAAIVFREYRDNGNGTAWCKFDLIGFAPSGRLLAKQLESPLTAAGHRYNFTWDNRILGIDLIGYKRYNVESGKFIRKIKAGDGKQISTTGEELVEFREWGCTEIVRGNEKTILNGKVLGEREWITLTEMDTIWSCDMKNGSVTKSSRIVTAPALWKSIVDGYFKYNDPYKYGIATIERAGWKRTGATRTFAGMQGEVWEHSKLGSMSVTDSVTAVPLFSSAIVGPVKSEVEITFFQAGKLADERFNLPIPKKSIKPLSLPQTLKGTNLKGIIKQN